MADHELHVTHQNDRKDSQLFLRPSIDTRVLMFFGGPASS